MTDDFNNKLADALWTLLEPRIDQKLANFRERLAEDDGLGMTYDDVDNRISDWMRLTFDLSDYHFDITDYSHEIDGMIDAQVQYLAEDGDLKDWLDINKTADEDNDDIFRQRVYSVINSEYDIRLVRK